jgi:hypothetical protein
MSSSLTEDYLRWLAPQIREDDGLSNPNKTYDGLLELMFETKFEFLDTVSRDENRAKDGSALRIEFCNLRNIRTNSLNSLGEASFLEVLIGLSRRLAFIAGGSAPGWAWILLANLNLHKLADPFTRPKARKASEALYRCIWREYEPDGSGGFFPLREPREDQRAVEIWYQMAAYVSEMER